MSRLLTFVIISSILVGCNSDKVGIQQISPSQVPSQNAPGVQGSTQKNTSYSQNNGPQTVYFNQIRIEDGSEPLINGVGFLASNSETQEPFVFSLTPMLPLGSQFMTPNANGLTLLATSGKQSEVDSMDITTLQRQKIDGIANPLSFAADSNGRISVWTDASGNAFYQNSTNIFSKLDLGGRKATTVMPGGPLLNFILTGGPTPQILAVNIKTGAIENTFQANQISMSPQGTKSLLLILGKATFIYDWKTNKSSSVLIKDEVNEPSWRNESLFAYWTESENGLSLKTFDLLTQTDQVVTQLNLSEKTSGIVCPTWIGNSLYYGDKEGLSFGIERADPSAMSTGEWKTADFALSAESRFGFVCPQSSTLTGVTK